MRFFDFWVIRTLYKRKLQGFAIRIWKFYAEVGLSRKLETAPLTDEERAFLDE